ncbi:hypothetical protein VN97_g3219 [Penicillium thymicola]|uniref:Uncharacterized protein n=1 Tax=Penicillium thymicola TaxID=293382 RepID=A0AAI9TNQ3_PENTH|nr:hypothetical protein VN97_g3219 [Penicillium thymicola]
MFQGYGSVALRVSLRRILALFSIVITLIRLCHESRLIPTLRLPPQLTLWTSIITPFALPTYALGPPHLFIRLLYPHAPASHPNSTALFVSTHLFASSQFQNERRT